MNTNNHYFLRLMARAIDFLLVGLIMQMAALFHPEFDGNPLAWFLVYNIVVILFNGRSLGKYSLSLAVTGHKKGWKGTVTLLLREVLLLVLSPILAINLLFVSPLPLHDRISGTKVIRDGR